MKLWHNIYKEPSTSNLCQNVYKYELYWLKVARIQVEDIFGFKILKRTRKTIEKTQKSKDDEPLFLAFREELVFSRKPPQINFLNRPKY